MTLLVVRSPCPQCYKANLLKDRCWDGGCGGLAGALPTGVRGRRRAYLESRAGSADTTRPSAPRGQPGAHKAEELGAALDRPGLTSDRAGCVGRVPRLWRPRYPSDRWAKLPGPRELPLRPEAGASRAQRPGGGWSWRPRAPLIPGRLPGRPECPILGSLCSARHLAAVPRRAPSALGFKTLSLAGTHSRPLLLARPITGLIVATKMTALDKERTRGEGGKDWVA